MQFSNETRINPENFQDSIPVIHGQNYYIDEQGYVSTYNLQGQSVFNRDGERVQVQTISQITEFIYIINKRVAYKTSQGILVTDLVANKEKYVGGFQGIAGFNEADTSYQYINSNAEVKSEVQFTGRINASRQLELFMSSTNTWVVPLGEFRCYIGTTLYTINYDSILPNAFGDTFVVTLVGWTNVDITPDTNYIRDIFIAGNTLYLSTRLQIIGSTPYNWSDINTSSTTVLWSEDSRLIGSYFAGNPTANYFYLVNYNTSSVYWIQATDLEILQEYEHNLPILGTGSIDKFTICIVDKEAAIILGAYVSLNTWLIKTRLYFKFNQLSAYEEMVTQYIREEVHYVRDLNTLVIKSSQRANMMLYILNNKVLSGCHTPTGIQASNYSAFYITEDNVYRYTRVEESGEYETLDKDTGVVNFENFIYIGSDLEPDVGGSTMRDTELLYEGKIAIVDGDDVSVESSGDVPADTEDLPVRTNQPNPENWWYLYSKTLRYPISYTDWVKISMMPTTKIFNISLVQDPTQTSKKKGK